MCSYPVVPLAGRAGSWRSAGVCGPVRLWQSCGAGRGHSAVLHWGTSRGCPQDLHPGDAHAPPWRGGPGHEHHSPPALCHLQWVLAFEIFIPLVLFFILLGLRQKKPTIPVKEGACEQVVPRASTPGGRTGTLGSCSSPLGQPGAEKDADSWQGSLGAFWGVV